MWYLAGKRKEGKLSLQTSTFPSQATVVAYSVTVCGFGFGFPQSYMPEI